MSRQSWTLTNNSSRIGPAPPGGGEHQLQNAFQNFFKESTQSLGEPGLFGLATAPTHAPAPAEDRSRFDAPGKGGGPEGGLFAPAFNQATTVSQARPGQEADVYKAPIRHKITFGVSESEAQFPAQPNLLRSSLNFSGNQFSNSLGLNNSLFDQTEHRARAEPLGQPPSGLNPLMTVFSVSKLPRISSPLATRPPDSHAFNAPEATTGRFKKDSLGISYTTSLPQLPSFAQPAQPPNPTGADSSIIRRVKGFSIYSDNDPPRRRDPVFAPAPGSGPEADEKLTTWSHPLQNRSTRLPSQVQTQFSGPTALLNLTPEARSLATSQGLQQSEFAPDIFQKLKILEEEVTKLKALNDQKTSEIRALNLRLGSLPLYLPSCQMSLLPLLKFTAARVCTSRPWPA